MSISNYIKIRREDKSKLYEENFNYYVSIMGIVGLLIILTIIVLNIMNLLSYEINFLINLCKLILCFVIFNIIYFKNYVEIENSFLWMKIYQTLKNRPKTQQNNNFNFKRNYTVKESLKGRQREKMLNFINDKKMWQKTELMLEHPLIIDKEEDLVNKDFLNLTIMNTTHNLNELKMGEKIIKTIELKNYKGEDGKRFLVLLKFRTTVKKQDFIEGRVLEEDNRLNLEQKIQVLDETREIVKETEIPYYDIEKYIWGEDRQTLSLNETIEESIRSIK